MNTPPDWVVPLMRAGYSARGIVYIAVGALALVASFDGGATPDAKSALATFLDEPLGNTVVGIIAIGLICYSIWRFVDALWDLDEKGHMARAGQLISGTTHLVLGWSVGVLAIDGKRGGGNNTDHWTATLMSQPFGRVLVGVVGGIVLAVGMAQFVKAFKEKYKDELVYTPITTKLDPLIKIGLIAHGAVILMVGGFLLWAAWTADPSQAGGLREALSMVRSADAGQWLFTVVASGLIAFASYCFIQAVYRIVPRCSRSTSLHQFNRIRESETFEAVI
jgi:hypothetical protein